jgi:hypothetical protein
MSGDLDAINHVITDHMKLGYLKTHFELQK